MRLQCGCSLTALVIPESPQKKAPAYKRDVNYIVDPNSGFGMRFEASLQ
jgi:hypothetical protein